MQHILIHIFLPRMSLESISTWQERFLRLLKYLQKQLFRGMSGSLYDYTEYFNKLTSNNILAEIL